MKVEQSLLSLPAQQRKASRRATTNLVLCSSTTETFLVFLEIFGSGEISTIPDGSFKTDNRGTRTSLTVI